MKDIDAFQKIHVKGMGACMNKVKRETSDVLAI